MKANEFERALGRLVDGELSQSEFNQLEVCLQSSAEARENYLQFIALHDGLDSELQSLSSAQTSVVPVVPIDEILKRQHKRNLSIALFVAAAVVLMTFYPLAMWLIDGEQSPAVTYRVAHSSSYSVSGRQGDKDVFQIEKGEHVILEQGSMELSFSNGVRSVVNGPAEFTLLDDDVLEMKRGVGWFQVPQQAIGFRVITESLEVVDLGTEFGVLAGAQIRDEVHVLKGKVCSKSLLVEGVEVELSAGDARVVSLSGGLRAIDLAPNAF
jgi:ferric-dicitrate binding protein FerR (iron transport regulator)